LTPAGGEAVRESSAPSLRLHQLRMSKWDIFWIMRLLLSLRAPTLSSIASLSLAEDRAIILRSVSSADNSLSEAVTESGGPLSCSRVNIGVHQFYWTRDSSDYVAFSLLYLSFGSFSRRAVLCNEYHQQGISMEEAHSERRYSWKTRQSIHWKSHPGGDGGGAEELGSWTST
jgi:hypothetical protein